MLWIIIWLLRKEKRFLFWHYGRSLTDSAICTSKQENTESLKIALGYGKVIYEHSLLNIV